MYKISIKPKIQKSISKLDNVTLKNIKKCIEKIALNPYSQGFPLTGRLKGLWKCRVNDYRIIYDIQNEELIIVVLKVGHRREVYDD